MQNYFYKMTNDDLRKYMLALLKALAHVHSLGYIHRDVKPANFLHRPGTDEFCLVDFGLAQSVCFAFLEYLISLIACMQPEV